MLPLQVLGMLARVQLLMGQVVIHLLLPDLGMQRPVLIQVRQYLKDVRLILVVLLILLQLQVDIKILRSFASLIPSCCINRIIWYCFCD